MAKQFGAFVTGDKELDRILATFEPKEVRKYVVKATDATIKNYVAPEYKRRINEAGFIETGATRDIAKKRRVKRSRVQFGSELYIDREKVVAMRKARGGRIGYDQKRGEDFFHPIAIEFGTETQEPERPLFKALKGNTEKALSEFRKALRAAINEVGRRAKATVRR